MGEYIAKDENGNVLCHYGVKGMKWHQHKKAKYSIDVSNGTVGEGLHDYLSKHQKYTPTIGALNKGGRITTNIGQQAANKGNSINYPYKNPDTPHKAIVNGADKAAARAANAALPAPSDKRVRAYLKARSIGRQFVQKLFKRM